MQYKVCVFPADVESTKTESRIKKFILCTINGQWPPQQRQIQKNTMPLHNVFTKYEKWVDLTLERPGVFIDLGSYPGLVSES